MAVQNQAEGGHLQIYLFFFLFFFFAVLKSESSAQQVRMSIWLHCRAAHRNVVVDCSDSHVEHGRTRNGASVACANQTDRSPNQIFSHQVSETQDFLKNLFSDRDLIPLPF